MPLLAPLTPRAEWRWKTPGRGWEPRRRLRRRQLGTRPSPKRRVPPNSPEWVQWMLRRPELRNRKLLVLLKMLLQGRRSQTQQEPRTLRRQVLRMRQVLQIPMLRPPIQSLGMETQEVELVIQLAALRTQGLLIRLQGVLLIRVLLIQVLLIQ